MRPLNFIVIVLAVVFSAKLQAQADKNKLFEESKGKWLMPIVKFNEAIDENMSLHDSGAGVTFITDSAYTVRAVFDGTVVNVFCLGENSYHLLTRFGNYFIVYSNINKPNLTRGEVIRAGQIIGKLYKEPDEKQYEFDMLLLKDKNTIPVYKWFNWKNNYLNECSD